MCFSMTLDGEINSMFIKSAHYTKSDQIICCFEKGLQVTFTDSAVVFRTPLALIPLPHPLKGQLICLYLFYLFYTSWQLFDGGKSSSILKYKNK